MRLPLIAVVAALFFARPLAAENRAASFVSLYHASDGLTVVSPQVSARASVHDQLDVVAGWEADVISAASIDVQTAASPRGYTEVRQGVTAGATWRRPGGTAIGARWMPSWEPDYASQTFTASFERELFDRRLTASLGARVSLDDVGRHGTPRSTWRALDTYGADASLAWVFGPRTVGHIAYELMLLDGYQASPYRFVPIAFAGIAPIGVAESVPTTRARHALGVGLRHSFARGWFTSGSYRPYRDSWGVTSHAFEVGLEHVMARGRVIVGASARAYAQSSASFYAERYVASAGEVPRYRTADKMLATSWSTLECVRASYALGPFGFARALTIAVKLERYDQRFIDFLPLALRKSTIASLGIVGEM